MSNNSGRPSSPQLISFDNEEDGFEDNFVDSGSPSWPWSQIFQPSSDGQMQVAKCESYVETFDPLKTRSSSSSSVIRDSRDSLAISDELNSLLQQPTPPAAVPPQNEKQTLAKSSSTSCCMLDNNTLHPNSEVDTRLRHANSDPMLLEQEENTGRSSQWNGINRRHRSSSYDDIDEHFTRSEGAPVFYIEASEPATSSLIDVKHKKNKKHSNKPSSIFYLSPKSSPKTSPKHSPKNSPQMKRHSISTGLPKSSKLVGKSRAQANSPALAKRKPRSATIDSLLSTTEHEKSKAPLSRHYRPGVLMLKDLNPRLSIIQKKLKEREQDFCYTKEMKVYCCTWNVNGQPASVSLKKLFNATEESKPETHDCLPDIYAIGFQELDLSAEALLLNESSREGDWKDAVDSGINQNDRNYYRVHAIRLVGMLLIVYARTSLRDYITDVEAETIGTGVMGVMGNKGGVAIRFNVYHTSLCFVNCHLAAHMEEVDKRNQDYNLIMTKLHFGKGTNAYRIMDHDMVFWIGDLNYRLQTSPTATSEMIRDYAEKYQIHTLQKLDQLNSERLKQTVFVDFIEGPIDFRPSYKYEPNTDNWDSSEKFRAPAWCDRILWYGSDVKQLYYRSHMSYRLSDHKPVSALMTTQVRVVDIEKERVVFEEIAWVLDKCENDTLPQVRLNQVEFAFIDVKFQEPQSQMLFVENIGLRPVQVSFIAKMKDQESCCKPWMSISPASRVVLPGETEYFDMIVTVDCDTAPSLSMGKDKIDDILVLHLEGGKDFFITISGNYLPSCFGLSLETLVHLHTFVREATPTKLAQIEENLKTISLDKSSKSMTSLPSLDIPKELWKLIDYLFRYGLAKENLFTDGGLKQEINGIRELLDTGGDRLWDNSKTNALTGKFSVFSVAAALLTFLEALAEPVIPVQFHQRCMECSNNTVLCKQILMQLPKVHRNTFVYVMAFLKEILYNSDMNKTDSKLLASLFGPVILRAPQGKQSDKSKRTEKKRKVAFLYQCLVNDVL